MIKVDRPTARHQARPAVRAHRCRPTGRSESREIVYAVTGLDAHRTTSAELATAIHGRWTVEALHRIKGVTFAMTTRVIRCRPERALPSQASPTTLRTGNLINPRVGAWPNFFRLTEGTPADGLIRYFPCGGNDTSTP
ncbi:hypothetical protein [Streptomyces sp. MJP52]|uniref:hypothetical protein n=1 Tax=Streptomyces sp. MJP52 TaxID=2940555 RepID=UPI002475CAD9|nr:hypothetical protein [Streptomyces sp. MJP52]